MFGTPPHEYEKWPEQSRGLAEALVELDASTNRFGIPLAQARDDELGWDVSFVTDHTEAAVKKEIKSRHGDKGLPDGMTPVVSLNPKTFARVTRQREAEAARAAERALEED